MQIIIQGHRISLTPALKKYAHKKFSRLTQFFKDIQKAVIVLDARNIENAERSQVAEVTAWVSGKKVLRAVEASKDMYAAIDLAFDEIRRQVTKHKEKHRRERKRQGSQTKVTLQALADKKVGSPIKNSVIVKINSFADKPLRENEALEEFKILNRDFLMFHNADTGGKSLVCLKNKKPKVVSPKRLTSLTPEQAQKKIAKTKALFLTFKNADTNELNIIYKRKSGNFGLVEPTL